MPTETELKQAYQEEHGRITREHYIEHSLDKATFEAQHTALVLKLEDDLLAIGAMPPKPAQPTDYKALWQQADTMAKKLAVMAKILNLE